MRASKHTTYMVSTLTISAARSTYKYMNAETLTIPDYWLVPPVLVNIICIFGMTV